MADQTALLLGPDFEDAQPLLYSEVAILLDHEEKNRKEGSEPSEMIQKTLQYSQRFGRLKTQESAHQVRKLLGNENLDGVEVASLGNLFPETVEEAKTLIPSLERFDDEKLQEILTNMAAFESKLF
mmetsp:Transcript_28230/g.78965  ORF Transcript_28230/g.78965 Transcript_28230/m.78965 type:complete len:126 (+) Transcript_28230:129-506(+)